MHNKIEFTLKLPCPNKCSYCPQDLLKSRYKGLYSIDVSSFEIMLNNVSLSTIIHFAGFSEPLFHSEFSQLLSLTVKKGYKVALNSTFVGLTKEKLIAIQSVSWDEFYYHVPVSSVYLTEEYFSLMDILFLQGPKLSFVPAIFSNISDFRLIKLLKDHGYSVEPNIKVHSRAGNLDIPSQTKLGPLSCCHGVRPCSVVLPNGDCYLCCMDYNLDYFLGNILNEFHENMFNSECYRSVVSAQESYSDLVLCRNCDCAIQRNLI